MSMSTWRYFVTDEQLNAKNWQMFEESKALRKRLQSVEDELKKFAASWMTMGRECSMANGRDFRIGEKRDWDFEPVALDGRNRDFTLGSISTWKRLKLS